MIKTLIEMPDHKKAALTVGKEYEILRTFGNGYVVRCDNDKENLILLQTRFQ